jgi:hypothetical protein
MILKNVQSFNVVYQVPILILHILKLKSFNIIFI